MAHIATLDTCQSAFVNNHDPHVAAWLGTTRFDT
jgi:hypothetical protein